MVKNITHSNNIVHLCKVKVTGFTFIRNALIYDYPIPEAVRSVLPLCDEYLFPYGQSNDSTLQLIQVLLTFLITSESHQRYTVS
jgi:hypothetical protein